MAEVVVPGLPDCREPCGACGDVRELWVVEVLVRPGDDIVAGQVVAVVETVKTTVEVAATEPGRVSAALVKPGDKVREGTALLRLS